MTAPQPVILIGAARSGTKYLRGLLAASSAARAVPYDINYVWRTGNEDAPDDRLDPATLTEPAAARIRRQILKLAGAGRDPGCRFVIEKTVSNALRVPFVARVLPEARYVHLVRDGRAVVESSMRQWQAKPEFGYLLRKLRSFPLSNWRYALWFARNALRRRGAGAKVWGPRYPGIAADMAGGADLLTVCTRQWERCVALAEQDLAAVPASQVFTIRYAELVGGTAPLEALGEWLGLPDTASLVAAHAAQTRQGNDEKWRDRLDAAQAARVHELAGPVLARWGFGDSAVEGAPTPS